MIVWIYGGGFTLGSSGMAMYSGENVAERADFRQLQLSGRRARQYGASKFTADSPHHASGDYGFLDQVAALQWVRRNIEKFGGDLGI